MSRTGYTNLGPSQERTNLLATICDHLASDPEQHSARVDALDYALRSVVREIEGKELEWISYLIGKIKADEVHHPENLTKLEARLNGKREDKLMSLGYNQAMLDHAQFPIRGEDGETALDREAVERIVERLREELVK